MRKALGLVCVALFSLCVAAFGSFSYVATHPAPAVREMAPMGFSEFKKSPVVKNVSVNRGRKSNQMTVFIRVPDAEADNYDALEGPFTRQEAQMYERDLYPSARGFCTDNCGRFTNPDDGPAPLGGEE